MERIRLPPRNLQVHNQTMRGRIDNVTWRLPDDLPEDAWIDSGIVLGRIGAGVERDKGEQPFNRLFQVGDLSASGGS